MRGQAPEIAVHYVALTPDEEWVMAAQDWPDRPGDYRLRVVRDGIILIDAGFRLVPGETVHERLFKGCEEWDRDRVGFERMFHANAREMGVAIPSYRRRGVTPFNCPKDQLPALAAEWLARVPSRLRLQDYRVFQPWAEADQATRLM